MSDDDLQLMTVATFDSLVAAEMARSFLDAEGITSVLADAEIVTWCLGGVKLQVPKSDFLAAERLLHSKGGKHRTGSRDDYGLPVRRDAITADPARAPLPDDPEDLEEEMTAEKVDPRDDLLGKALMVAVLGAFICPFVAQAYSLYLLFQAQELPTPWTSRQRWWLHGLQALNVLVLVGLAALIVVMTSRYQR